MRVVVRIFLDADDCAHLYPASVWYTAHDGWLGATAATASSLDPAALVSDAGV